MKHTQLSISEAYTYRLDARNSLPSGIPEQDSNPPGDLALTCLLWEGKYPAHPSEVTQLTASTSAAVLTTKEILCRPPF